MIRLSNKKYFLLLFIHLFLIIASNYSYAGKEEQDNNSIVDDNTLNYHLNGRKFTQKIPEFILNYYEKDPMTFYVPGNELFSEPLQLLLLQNLLKEIIKVFNKNEIDFWITENTLYEFLMFNSFAPWANQATIAVYYDQLNKKLKKITKKLKRKGIVFDPFERINNLQHIPYLTYTPKQFFKVVKEYEPNFSTDEIMEKYDQLKYKTIQIDIHPFIMNHFNAYNALGYLHDIFISLGGSKKGYETQEIYPLQQEKLNNIVVNVVKNTSVMLEIKEYLDNIYCMHVGKILCTNSTPIYIKDIRQHISFLELINRFLSFTFTDQFHGMSKNYRSILSANSSYALGKTNTESNDKY